MKAKKKLANVHLRVPAEIHEKIVESAAKNRRPITSEILVRLESTLEGAKP